MLQKTSAATDTVARYPSLIDKRVIVTGGGSGIGEGLVEAFVAQGARVAFVDIAEEAAQALVDRLTPDARHAPIQRHCDLTNLDSLKAIFADLEAALGGVDILVNNAGNDDRHSIAEVTPAYWDERLNVNLRHQFFAAQAVMPAMKRAGGGAILNFGSISWHLGLNDLVLKGSLLLFALLDLFASAGAHKGEVGDDLLGVLSFSGSRLSGNQDGLILTLYN